MLMLIHCWTKAFHNILSLSDVSVLNLQFDLSTFCYSWDAIQLLLVSIYCSFYTLYHLNWPVYFRALPYMYLFSF